MYLLVNGFLFFIILAKVEPVCYLIVGVVVSGILDVNFSKQWEVV